MLTARDRLDTRVFASYGVGGRRSGGGPDAPKSGSMERDALGAPAGISVVRLRSVDGTQIDGLADLLLDCVDGGAGVGFLRPLAPDKARAFWRTIAEGVAAGRIALLVAHDGTGIVGTVQLILDKPENQPHRADLAKMLVHRRVRRRGLGAALMRAAEQMARDLGKTLLVLDTFTDSDAERLYARLGWVRVGVIPDYAYLTSGDLRGTTVFFKSL